MDNFSVKPPKRDLPKEKPESTPELDRVLKRLLDTPPAPKKASAKITSAEQKNKDGA